MRLFCLISLMTLACAQGAAAQTPAEVMARINGIASGEYAARVEADRARTPPASLSQARIQALAKSAIANELRDPASAQYRGVRRIQHSNGTTMYCGEVKGRNAYGGYSDFVRFEAGVTTRGDATAQLDGRDGIAGTYFQSAWNQFCGRITGTPIRF